MFFNNIQTGSRIFLTTQKEIPTEWFTSSRIFMIVILVMIILFFLWVNCIKRSANNPDGNNANTVASIDGSPVGPFKSANQFGKLNNKKRKSLRSNHKSQFLEQYHQLQQQIFQKADGNNNNIHNLADQNKQRQPKHKSQYGKDGRPDTPYKYSESAAIILNTTPTTTMDNEEISNKTDVERLASRPAIKSVFIT